MQLLIYIFLFPDEIYLDIDVHQKFDSFDDLNLSTETQYLHLVEIKK